MYVRMTKKKEDVNKYYIKNPVEILRGSALKLNFFLIFLNGK